MIADFLLGLVLIRFEELSSQTFTAKYEEFLDGTLSILEKYLAKLGIDLRNKLSRVVKAIGDLVVSKSKIEVPFKDRAKKLISQKVASVVPMEPLKSRPELPG